MSIAQPSEVFDDLIAKSNKVVDGLLEGDLVGDGLKEAVDRSRLLIHRFRIFIDEAATPEALGSVVAELVDTLEAASTLQPPMDYRAIFAAHRLETVFGEVTDFVLESQPLSEIDMFKSLINTRHSCKRLSLSMPLLPVDEGSEFIDRALCRGGAISPERPRFRHGYDVEFRSKLIHLCLRVIALSVMGLAILDPLYYSHHETMKRTCVSVPCQVEA